MSWCLLFNMPVFVSTGYSLHWKQKVLVYSRIQLSASDLQVITCPRSHWDGDSSEFQNIPKHPWTRHEVHLLPLWVAANVIIHYTIIQVALLSLCFFGFLRAGSWNWLALETLSCMVSLSTSTIIQLIASISSRHTYVVCIDEYTQQKMEISRLFNN